MNRHPDLLKDNTRQLFFRYLIPSISATLVTSIYVLADTIIIGKGIGTMAVAALNLVLPLFTIFFGIGLLFGLGGSVLMSIRRGQGDEKGANAYFSTALAANVVMMLLFYIIGIFFFEPVAYMLGSSESTIGLVREYGKFLVIGTGFFMFSTFLQTFIRNDRAPKLAMIAVVTGGILNIILDMIFVYTFQWGIGGAAFATVLGSVITCCILVTHFFSKNNSLQFKLELIQFRLVGNIIKNGLSCFLVELSAGIVVFFFNLQILSYIGDIGVTVYSIISNTAIVIMSISNGIAQAAQPIVTMNYGAGKMERVQSVKKIGLVVSGVFGVVAVLIGVLFPYALIEMFINPTSEILAIAPNAIRIYFVSFLFFPMNIFVNNYFQARVMPFHSLAISLLRGFFLSVVLIYLLPSVMGELGIWITMPIVEVITIMVAAVMIRREPTTL